MMTRSVRLCNLLASASTLMVVWAFATPVAAQVSDYLDTRVNFVFSDDNLLADPGETLVNSPTADFGPRDGNFFPFENLDTRDSGQETLTHLVLYSAFPGFSDTLLTEAALVIRSELFGEGGVAIQDDGSYIRLTHALGQSVSTTNEAGILEVLLPERNFEVTLFPYTSERFRLGYLYDLSWGDAGIYTELNDQPVPALRMQYNDSWGYSFLGAKTTRQLTAEEDPNEEANNELNAFYGVLGGFGINFGDSVMWETNGGFFHAGDNRKSDVVGEPVNSWGVSTRLSLFNGVIRPGTSIDFRLYENSTEFSDAFLRSTPSYSDGLSWMLSFEGTTLFQTLGDPDIVGGTTVQPAFASAIQFDVAIENWDIQTDVVFRDLAFILFDVPGLDPFNAFPEGSEQDPELLAALSGQYYIESARVTPGLLVGVQIPAAYRGLPPTTPSTPEVNQGEQTVVVRNNRNFEPLPPGEAVLPVYSAKLSFRWDISPILSTVAQIQYSHDPNQTRLIDNEFGVATRTFRDPDLLGFAIITQARF